MLSRSIVSPSGREILIMAGALFVLGIPVCTSAAQSDPENFLSRKCHLVRVERYWITVAEIRLRNNLDRVARIAVDLRKRQQQYEQAIINNNALNQRLIQAELEKAQIEGVLAANRLDAHRKDQFRQRIKQLKQQIEELKSLSSPPHQFGNRPAFRRLQIDRINLHNALALVLLQSATDTATLADDYRQLSKKPAVKEAIDGLKISGQLGPMRNYDQPVKDLKKYEQLAFPSEVPTYLLAGNTRCSVLLDDRVPATFTWDTGCDIIRITTNMARAAGLQVPEEALTEFHTFPGNRRLKVTRVTIPQLRVGHLTFRNLPALLLPPEGEDLGSSIGPLPLGGLVSEEPTRGRLKVEKKE